MSIPSTTGGPLAILPTKVVLDSAASSALLSLAYKEGMLSETERADCTLSSLARRQHPNWLTAQALEQVVLFEQVHLTERIAYEEVHGELLDSDIFVPVLERASPSAEIETIDPALLNGILKARGISPTPFEDSAKMERIQRALVDLEKWRVRYSEEPPSSMSLFFERFLSRRTGKPEEPKYVELAEIRVRLEEFTPIANAIQEYLEVTATAKDRYAHVMTSVFPTETSSLYHPPAISLEANTPTTLLRLTSSKLGVLPFGQTLRETLLLAKDPASKALRAKIFEWTDSLTMDNGAATERIQKEIANAIGHLNRASVGGRVSDICTYLSIPTALFAPVAAFVSVLGWIVTIAGSFGLAGKQITGRAYNWASFGSSNRIK